MVGQRYRYSRWAGTQQGFELDAFDVMGELADDLMYHGDPMAALRRLMQEGFEDRNGERISGLRDLLREGGQLGVQTVALAACLPGLIGKQCQLLAGR